MAIYKTVIKTGQFWRNKSRSGSYRITRVDEPQGIQGRKVYAVYIEDGVKVREECSFGYINEDGTPFDWDDGWECEEPSFECKPKTYQSDLDFFKAVAPGCCVCNIPREACTFHR